MTAFFTIAHRGASAYEPENTLRSIRRALELGADGIEIDLHLSSDGHPVVIHDDTLRRTTGHPGRVADLTLSQLQRLNAGAGEAIPTLHEVLDLVAGRAWLNLELKGRGTALPALRQAVCAVESGRWQPGQIVISSFSRRELALVAGLVAQQKAESPVGVGLLLNRPPLALGRISRRFGATSLHVARALASPGLIRRAKALGLRVLVYTVNDPAEIDRLRARGVDGVFTDAVFPVPAGQEVAMVGENR